MAAKIFVFVISQNFREIFNFVFREIFLEFREISRNTKLKFGRNFSQFREAQNLNLGNIFAILQKRDDFFITTFFKNYLFFGHNVH